MRDQGQAAFPPPGHGNVLSVADIPSHFPDPRKPFRLSHSTTLWIRQGAATLRVDQNDFELSPGTWVFLSPYQPFSFRSAKDLAGWMLHFHYDFFCVEKHGVEVGCKEVLYNSPYRTPLVHPDEKEAADMAFMMERLKEESVNTDPDRLVLSQSFVKALLMTASRSKVRGDESSAKSTIAASPVAGELRQLIDGNFREKRSPADYAEMLKLSPKALGRMTKAQWGKTISQLLQERLIIEAKRELYLTDKPIKRIAMDLGFTDEYYFSRFFKKLALVPPQGYRDNVGMGRAMGVATGADPG